MLVRTFLNIFILISINSGLANGKTLYVNFSFFSQPLQVYCDQSMDIDLSAEISDTTISDFYNQLDNSNYRTTFNELQAYKEAFQLNDWGFYLLLRQSGEALFTDKSKNYQTLFNWFLLIKAGYRTKVSYLKDLVLLSVYTKDKVYDLPSKEFEEGWMVDITQHYQPALNDVLAAQQYESVLNYYGKPFSFQLEQPPAFPQAITLQKKLSFRYNSLLYNLEVRTDQLLMHFMYQYPELSPLRHSYIPLSEAAKQSLFPALKRMIRNKDHPESIRLLLSFLRQSFNYKEDKDAYNSDNITFSPEETIFYDYSDCEDRSVLFAYLLRELLNVEVLIVEYQNHTMVAIELEQAIGIPILYNNRSYTVCDPTGPSDQLNIGEYPDFVEPSQYEVIEN